MPPECAKLLWDMRDAASRIERFATGKTLVDYIRDEMLRAAIERQFEIIGEAMTRLARRDPVLAASFTDHRKIARFRNALFHGYDSIDHETSWSIVETKLPILARELDALLGG